MLIYLITNKVNGKKYVGQHSGDDLEKYWLRQVRLAELGYKGKTLLYRAIRKHGKENFKVETLIIVGTKSDMDYYERKVIAVFDTKAPNGYNLTDGGDGVLGLPDEFLKKRNEKISAALLGNTNCAGRFESEETRKKKSLANLGNKHSLGAVRTPEYCKAISDRQQGRQFTDVWRQRMSEAAKGRKASQETRDKLSAIQKASGNKPPKRTSEEAAEAGRISGHKRYHLSKNVVSLGCKFCNPAVTQ